MPRFGNISRRIVAQVAIDACLMTAATAFAYILKYDLPDQASLMNRQAVLWTLPVLIVLRLGAIGLFHLYRIHWRYMSLPDLRLLLTAISTSSLAFYLFLLVVGLGGQADYSWGMQVMDWGINLLLLSGVRIGYRELSDLGRSWGFGRTATDDGGVPDGPSRRTLIVGAGDSGETLARDLKRRPQGGLLPLGFVDDDPFKRKIRIQGLPVLGDCAEIPEIAHRLGVEVILIAIPNASGKTIRDILAHCEQTTARLCIVPSVGEMVRSGGGPRHAPVRDINIEDLLRRAAVRTDMEKIAGYVSGHRVLVTGAGGSIGSELCRQIAALNPARLILVGQGENSVFEIEQEMIREFGFATTAVIGSVRDRGRIEEIFLHERPTVVFHAAAHKHVPLMEANPQEAVKNNILGTRNVAEVAAECGVKKFILVSTDKAVNPSSVMGATKRICEMIIQTLARTTRTEFAAVRFGNVLGSRGSVIPTMRKQILRGGPVTVTHPEMTRYFMTIPEAVQLILQAGAMGGNGEIYILDMGDPVRILDLARDLIRLSGFRPDSDIKIEYTGTRPGEKLHEELLYTDEQKRATEHAKIFVSDANGIDPATLRRAVDRLIRIASEGERPEVLRSEVLRVAHGQFTGEESQDSRPTPKAVSPPASSTSVFEGVPN